MVEKMTPQFQAKMEQVSKDLGKPVSFDENTIRQMNDADTPSILLTILKALEDLDNRVVQLEKLKK